MRLVDMRSLQLLSLRVDTVVLSLIIPSDLLISKGATIANEICSSERNRARRNQDIVEFFFGRIFRDVGLNGPGVGGFAFQFVQHFGRQVYSADIEVPFHKRDEETAASAQWL